MTDSSSSLLFGIFLLLLFASCQQKETASKHEPSAAPATSVGVYGASEGQHVPPVCKEYASKLLRCVEDPHFPADAREAQRGALEQMMASMQLEGMPESDRRRHQVSHAELCRDSLSTMRESGKSSCPGIF